jgi:hypothetical protein
MRREVVVLGAIVIAVLVVGLLATTLVPYSGEGGATTRTSSSPASPTTSVYTNSTASQTESTAKITNFTPSEEIPPSGSNVTEVEYACVIGNSPAGVLVMVNDTKDNLEVEFTVNASAPLSLMGLGCSYSSTKIVTPTACGVMCDGGVGDTISTYDTWNLNFSFGSSDYAAGHNLTISSNDEFGSPLFSGFTDNKVYLNAQPISPWYSDPPCTSSDGIEQDCMLPDATSVSIELPASFENGQYQLTIYSAIELVP